MPPFQQFFVRIRRSYLWFVILVWFERTLRVISRVTSNAELIFATDIFSRLRIVFRMLSRKISVSCRPSILRRSHTLLIPFFIPIITITPNGLILFGWRVSHHFFAWIDAGSMLLGRLIFKLTLCMVLVVLAYTTQVRYFILAKFPKASFTP